MMTINEFKNQAISLLSGVTENPRFEAEQLIKWGLGIQRNDLVLRRREEIPAEKEELLKSALNRRLSREPLQYICGEWDFFGLRMFCGKGCLIPRPETELIAEYAIRMLPKGGCLLDLCTGSGCIAVSVLNNRPDVTATAVDISPEALAYAKKNADYHGISSDKIEIICKDIFDFVPEKKYDVIVSNPPYIKSDDIPGLSPEVQFEPYIALDGGKDGLDFYRLIADNYHKYLKKGGSVLIEVGYDIAEDVSAVFKAKNYDTRLVADLFGIDRMCIANKI